jgi:hypothetical protein
MKEECVKVTQIFLTLPFIPVH